MTKKIIFILIISLLFLPLLQRELGFFSFAKLYGSFVNTSKIKLSVENWYSGKFQKHYDENFSDSIGFKEIFVRLNNELAYRLYGIAKSPNMVLGKEEYIYLNSYIDSYMGYNYIGEENIENNVYKLSGIQKYFNENNITFMVVFTPSKATFYPEYIPEHFKKNTKSNYDSYIEKFATYNINNVDLITYFNEIKDTTSYPLFPKNGLHWSSYGMAIGIDTLIHKIEKDRNVKLPEFSWVTPVNLTDSVIKPDRDAEKLMNLYSSIPQQKMPQMQFLYNTNNNTVKPKVLFISDSYYWQAYEQKVHENEFSFGGFWYYNKTAYEGGGPLKVNEFNIKNKLLKQDIIILFASDATLNLFPFGFDKFYEEIMPTDTSSLTNYFKTELKINRIEEIKNKANKNNITIDKQLEFDAEYLMKQFLSRK